MIHFYISVTFNIYKKKILHAKTIRMQKKSFTRIEYFDKRAHRTKILQKLLSNNKAVKTIKIC